MPLIVPKGGEKIESKQSKLLGEILNGASIDFSESGVHIKQLLEGSSSLTYEELQFVMNENSSTRILSINLKQELQTSECLMYRHIFCIHDYYVQVFHSFLQDLKKKNCIKKQSIVRGEYQCII